MAHDAIDVLSPFRLDDRVAVVTGASSGLGARFARVLHGAGATVVVGGVVVVVVAATVVGGTVLGATDVVTTASIGSLLDPQPTPTAATTSASAAVVHLRANA